jgi:esterase/lipase
MSIGATILVVCVALVVITRANGIEMVTNPMEDRDPIDETPADYGLPYEDVTVTTGDGLDLAGWYVPSQNGAVIMAQHGFQNDREEMLTHAQMLGHHGYGVLITSFRTHDLSEGELITWGRDEMQDLEAWFRYLLTRDDVDPDRIGAVGNSFGGAMSIKYAAENEEIKAVVTHSAFSSIDDSVEIGVKQRTGLPPFPFAPMIVFWAERHARIDTSEIDSSQWIKGICGRPVFILQGGADEHISPESGQDLFGEACEPKEFWFEQEAGHCTLHELKPQEFEERVVAFFDRYLLEE